MNKEIKRLCNGLNAEFNIGKNGLTKTFIDQIDKYLEAHDIVKIKCTGVEDKSQLRVFAEDTSQKTHSEIVEIKGFTFVVYRK